MVVDTLTALCSKVNCRTKANCKIAHDINNLVKFNNQPLEADAS